MFTTSIIQYPGVCWLIDFSSESQSMGWLREGGRPLCTQRDLMFTCRWLFSPDVPRKPFVSVPTTGQPVCLVIPNPSWHTCLPLLTAVYQVKAVFHLLLDLQDQGLVSQCHRNEHWTQEEESWKSLLEIAVYKGADKEEECPSPKG